MYRPATLSEPLAEYLERELEEIERAFSLFDFARLKQLNAEPAKPRAGMVVYADGMNWNPGSGEGIYAYHSGSWNLLG